MNNPINFFVVAKIKEYFLEEDENKCWPWLGSLGRGYPRIQVDKKEYLARTVMVLWHLGLKQTDKKLICICDNKLCMNYLKHLKLVTQLEVVQETIKRGMHTCLHQNGENHPIARFCNDDIKDIRRQFWEEKVTMIELAQEYNCNNSLISHILSRKLWNHVDDGYPAYKKQVAILPEPDSIILPSKYIETEIKQIKLIDGTYTLVSEIDYLHLLSISMEWKMYENVPLVVNANDYTMKMHNIIGKRMGINYLDVIDHADRNQRNNTRSNLRPATNGQSAFNKGTRPNYSTGLRGVYKDGNKFIAKIGYKNETIHLGTWSTKEKAKEEYIKYGKLYYGEFFDPELHG